MENQTTYAYRELLRNLKYARELVKGGHHLEQLHVGGFEVTDLYRSAIVMSVAALDHWVHEEIYHRAVSLALAPSKPKPAKFARFNIPMSLFDQVHYGSAELESLFYEHLRNELGHLSFQNPIKIKEGFALVSDVQLWQGVATVMSTEQGKPMTQHDVKDRLTDIVKRRNRIAHSADREPGNPKHRSPISRQEVDQSIDFLEFLASAIVVALNNN